MMGPGHVGFRVVEGTIRLVHILGHFRNVVVHFQSVETVFEKFSNQMGHIHILLMINSAGDRSLRITDAASLADMTVE